MTFGFKENPKDNQTTTVIPMNYFCFAKVLNHDQNVYYGVKIQKNAQSKVNQASETVFLREKVITEKDDPMPSKDTYWNEDGLKKQAATTPSSSGFYISELTKEIEVIYINTDDVHQVSAEDDF